MNATENALAELRKQIEINKKLLAEQERALVVLETMMGYSRKPASTAVLTPSNAITENGMIALEDIDSKDDADKQTLRAQVTNLIERLGDQEFSVAHIDAALKKMEVVVNGKYPRSRISMVLSKLEESGILTRTFSGSGRLPNKYKLKLKEQMS